MTQVPADLSAHQALVEFLELMVPYVDEFDVKHVAQGYALLARIDQCYGAASDDGRALTPERATVRTVLSVPSPFPDERVDIIEALTLAGLPMPKLDTAGKWQRAIDDFNAQGADG